MSSDTNTTYTHAVNRRISPTLVFGSVLAVTAAICATSAKCDSRTSSPAVSQGKQTKRGSVRATDKVYEDDAVRIRIPHDWKVLRVGRPDDPLAVHAPMVAGLLPSPGDGVVLGSRGYILTLFDKASQASGMIGGRFIEVFQIPWIPDAQDAWGCGDFLRKVPEQAGDLQFISLTLDQPSSRIHQVCHIPANVMVRHRWFAGYFSSSEEGYFFEHGPSGCVPHVEGCLPFERVYTLTGYATTPSELPDVSDPTLQKVIKEAIQIVDSIQYKRLLASSP